MRNKRRETLQKTLNFVFGFIICALMLIAMAFAVINLNIPVKGNVTAKVDEQKTIRGNFLVAVLDSHDYNSADVFFLIGFSAQDPPVKLLMLPGDTLAFTEERTDTLSGQYGYGGIEMCAKAVEYTYGIKVHRYAVAGVGEVEKITDYFGGLNLDLRDGVNLTKDDIVLNLNAGKQTLGGGQVALLFDLPGGDKKYRNKLRADIVKEGILSYLFKISTNENVFCNVIDILNTNISYNDYIKSKKALRALLSGSKEIVHQLDVDFIEKEGFSEITDQGLNVIKQAFGH